jgi:hypothetical protein
MSLQHKPLLDALGAETVTGGIPHRDSVPAQSTSGERVALTPGERILPPEYALVGRLINTGAIAPEDGQAIVGYIQERKKQGEGPTDTELRSLMVHMVTSTPAVLTLLDTGGILPSGRSYFPTPDEDSIAWHTMKYLNGNPVGSFSPGNFIDSVQRSLAGGNIMVQVQQILSAQPQQQQQHVDLEPMLNGLDTISSEISKLRTELAEKELSMNVMFTGLLEGQRFLSKHMPAYEEFARQKYID